MSRFWKVGTGVHVCSVKRSRPLTLPVTPFSSGHTAKLSSTL
jgi:hypothetical protein